MSPAVTILPEARLTEAVDLMLTKEIHRLIVLEPDLPEGPPLGLISTTDIVVEMASPGSAWRL
jgi:CBS domain-containing protein